MFELTVPDLYHELKSPNTRENLRNNCLFRGVTMTIFLHISSFDSFGMLAFVEGWNSHLWHTQVFKKPLKQKRGQGIQHGATVDT